MLKVNVKKNGHIVEYEISGSKFDVQRAIVDIYNQYSAKEFATFVQEHLVDGESATAFMTRNQGEDEGEGPLDAPEGIGSGCGFATVGYLLLFLLIVCIVVVLRIL